MLKKPTKRHKKVVPRNLHNEPLQMCRFCDLCGTFYVGDDFGDDWKVIYKKKRVINMCDKHLIN